MSLTGAEFFSQDFDEKFCRETVPSPCLFVLSGASGDLAKRKIFPAFAGLKRAGLLHPESRIVALTRRFSSLEEFKRAVSYDELLDKEVCHFNFDPDIPEAGKRLACFLDSFDTPEFRYPRIYYYALPFTAYRSTLSAMSEQGMFEESSSTAFRNIVLEKPLGRDRKDAGMLRDILQRLAKPHQIYLIDHYLGKDDVQNILMLRFANTLFSGVWSNSCIERITIGTQESCGVAGRASYFDSAGIVTDMFQSHLLLMLGYCIMECPGKFDFDSINSELENALRKVTGRQLLFSGQYEGYLQENAVAANSRTPTCADVILSSSAKRWTGVQFRLFAGKYFACDRSFICVDFKGNSMPFSPNGISLPGNRLELELKPHPSIRLTLCSKRSGPHLCLGNLTLSHTIPASSRFSDGYFRLLLDCQNCDRTLYPGFDVLSENARICDTLSEEIYSSRLEIYSRKSLDFSC